MKKQEFLCIETASLETDIDVFDDTYAMEIPGVGCIVKSVYIQPGKTPGLSTTFVPGVKLHRDKNGYSIVKA